MVRGKVENGQYEVSGFLPQEAPSIPEKPSLVSPQGRDRRPQKDLWKSPKHKILLVVKQGSAVVSTCTSGGGGILILVILPTTYSHSHDHYPYHYHYHYTTTPRVPFDVL